MLVQTDDRGISKPVHTGAGRPAFIVLTWIPERAILSSTFILLRTGTPVLYRLSHLYETNRTDRKISPRTPVYWIFVDLHDLDVANRGSFEFLPVWSDFYKGFPSMLLRQVMLCMLLNLHPPRYSARYLLQPFDVFALMHDSTRSYWLAIVRPEEPHNLTPRAERLRRRLFARCHLLGDVYDEDVDCHRRRYMLGSIRRSA
jgi:hypothetical protein